MATAAPTDLGTLLPSRGLLVMARQKGLRVQYGNDLENQTVPLSLADLTLLERMAGSEATSTSLLLDQVSQLVGADRQTMGAKVVRLLEAELLRPRAGADTAESGGPHGASEAPTTATVEADQAYLLLSPVVFGLDERGFVHEDHDGNRSVRLHADELHLASLLLQPLTPEQARQQHDKAGGRSDIDATAVIARLVDAGVVVPAGPDTVDDREKMAMRTAVLRKQRLAEAVSAAVAGHDDAERSKSRPDGSVRVRVQPVEPTGRAVPLALGMILGYAAAHGGDTVDTHFQFVPRWLTRPTDIETMEGGPSVYLYSNYIWTHHQNLRMSADLKAANPRCVNVHGGPDTPKYEADTDQYFRANPHVDVAVHGEGEATFCAMLQALVNAWDETDGGADLDALEGVEGLSYRGTNGIVHNGSRDRITELDTIPSPLLDGMFEPYGAAGIGMGILETNRGCPYGCTFCDWGSATASRIRKFDLDRVFDEIEWYARNKVDRIFVADANFGIFERDVEIAEKVAEVRSKYGSPLLFSTNYAKNTTKHLRKVVETLGDAGILTQGLLSLQSMDPATLKTVKRSNIKLEKYEDLAHEFRRNDLPLFVDLMLGLPGATPTSFHADLQGCVDREITAKVYPTELLVNSPMNEPAYKAEHRIEIDAPPEELVKTTITGPGAPRRALLVSTSSYSRDEYDSMLDLRLAHLALENLGGLRHVARFVRQELGIEEVEFYEKVRSDAVADPDRWPTLNFTVRVVPFVGTPPVSWRWFIDEVRDYLETIVGLPPSSAMDTVLRVQHGLLPSRGRTFPEQLALEHDYASWFLEIVNAKDSGNPDWVDLVPRLETFPPASFTVDDTHQVCDRGLGCRIDENAHAAWELDSPVHRAVSHEHLSFSS